jgi:hypothetical protein
MTSSRLLSYAFTGLAGVAVTASLVLVAAPSASALLCGYPPKACPKGQTNPTKEATVAPGILLLSNEDAMDTPKLTYSARPSLFPLDAPVVSVPTSDGFRGLVRNLPRDKTVIVSILMQDGKFATIGIVRADSDGYAYLPAVRLSRPEPTTFMIVTQGGGKRFVTYFPKIG